MIAGLYPDPRGRAISTRAVAVGLGRAVLYQYREPVCVREKVDVPVGHTTTSVDKGLTVEGKGIEPFRVG